MALKFKFTNNHDTNKKLLLEELDLLGYSKRMKEVALLGRQSWKRNQKEEYAGLLVALLESGTAYEAHLALTGAAVTGDSQAVMLALKHAKSGVRKRAAALLTVVVTDSTYNIEAEIITFSLECRDQLLDGIVKNNRQDWAERLLELVLSRWGAKEAGKLLSICSEETVSNRLPQIGYAINNWRLLTKRHPDEVIKYVDYTLQQAAESEKLSLWWTFDTAIEELSVQRPAMVLDFALKYGPRNYIHPVIKQQLGRLMLFDSSGVFELLTRDEIRGHLIEQGIPPVVLKKRSCFTTEQWTVLGSILSDNPTHLAKVLDTLAPSKRTAIFNAAYPEYERKLRVFPISLLDVLPHQLRDSEAKRMLGLREIQENEEQMLEITARLLIDHAREQLVLATKTSNANERANAYGRLIQSTALSRRGMEETLHFLIRVKNDQDPVRMVVMSELANCPVTLFNEEQISDLTLLVDMVVEARDTSYGTRLATEKLAFRILQAHALEMESSMFGFALWVFERMTLRSGQFMLFSRDWSGIPTPALESLFDKIYDFSMEANKRENDHVIIQIADAFGKAIDRLPKLQSLLGEIVKSKKVSRQAVRYWLAPYDTRDERVRELLDLDPTFIAFYEVFQHLHLKRQEWLDPYIAGKILKGKHLTGKTIYLIPARDGFHRYLPRQQQQLATLLERVALDTKRSFYERASAMRSLASLPDYESAQWDLLLQDKEVHVVEAALHAHSLIEQPEQVILMLLDNLEGDRARVAMYSIPRCARRVNPIFLTSKLSALLNRDKLKITVKKEAIRLLGYHRSSENQVLLLREHEKPNNHKDVIIAIGHAVRQYLDYEQSWEILDCMSLSLERDIVRSLFNQSPVALPRKMRQRYLQLITKVTSHSDPVVVNDAFRTMTSWVHGNEFIIAEFAGKIFVDLQKSGQWRAALDTLIMASSEGLVNDRVVEFCRQLLNAGMQEQCDTGSKRDLPARQRLIALIDKLVARILPERKRLTSLFIGIIDYLKKDDSMKLEVIRLQLAMTQWDNPDLATLNLDQITQSIEQEPLLLEYVCNQTNHIVNSSVPYWRPEQLLDIVVRLEQDHRLASTYVALSLLKIAGVALLWNDTCKALLNKFRNHEHGLVVIKAMNIWTVKE